MDIASTSEIDWETSRWYSVFEERYNKREELFEFKTDKGCRHALVSSILCFCYFVPLCADVFSLTEQVIEGLDKAVLTLKKGEVALLSIAPEYAFGSSESRHELAVVLANSIIYYDVELVLFEKVRVWIISNHSTLSNSIRKMN